MEGLLLQRRDNSQEQSTHIAGCDCKCSHIPEIITLPLTSPAGRMLLAATHEDPASGLTNFIMEVGPAGSEMDLLILGGCRMKTFMPQPQMVHGPEGRQA